MVSNLYICEHEFNTNNSPIVIPV